MLLLLTLPLSPGVYQLQDTRSRVFNFDPYLQKIMPVAEFNFDALKEYITSSRDELLSKMAQTHSKRYVGSTSSMTGTLSQFHYLLSQWRQLSLDTFSKGFNIDSYNFTNLSVAPNSVFLRWQPERRTYAIDADKSLDSPNVLMMLGKSLEKLLTLPTSEYERYRVSSADSISEEERQEGESYHYTTYGDFLMRSQLDAHDPRLPGTGMFDLKTRAVVSVRHEQDYQHGTGYQIKYGHGQWESYEREFYDMIRAVMLKYSLQVRMGRMDGLFCAYHNVERIFGFQYLHLSDLDVPIHGQSDTTLGDQEFKVSLELLNQVLNSATEKFPDQVRMNVTPEFAFF